MHENEPDRPMWMLNHMVNPLVRALLRSPLHPLLSRRLVLLRVTGRRSDRTFELPVGYVRNDTGILVTVGAPDRKQWWRNFGCRPRSRGKARAGVASALT
jgi:hypothetical protein